MVSSPRAKKQSPRKPVKNPAKRKPRTPAKSKFVKRWRRPVGDPIAVDEG